MMNTIISLIAAAVTFGTVLMYGTLGEVLTERSGNLNLGVEGIMFMGGAFGLGGVFYYEQAVGEANSSAAVALLIALASAFAAGAIASLIFSFLTITLRANQNVTGLALTIFGTGVGQFTGEYMRVHQGGYVALSNHLKEFFSKSIFPQGLQNIPVAGKLLFSHSLFFYLALVLAVIMWWFLYKYRPASPLRRRKSRHGGCRGHQRHEVQIPLHDHRRRHLRHRRHGLHRDDRGLRLEPRGPLRRRLAGRRTGHLLHVASAVGDLGFDLLRRDDPVSPPDHPLYPDPAL